MDATAVAVHSAFDEIEDDFHRALEASLDPRGPEAILDLVASLALARGAKVVDVGCGRGDHTIELAERFGFDVLGIDPVARYGATRREVANGAVRFAEGIAESIPVDAATIDLVFCRESLMFADLAAATAEFARVLRPGGQGLVYLVLTGPLMDDVEAVAFHARGRAPSLRPSDVDDALIESGFVIDRRIDFQGEWGERRQERDGEPGRRLLYASRLLRDPERYIAEFGQENYDIMLGDCLWFVYRMIGKLTGYACTFHRP